MIDALLDTIKDTVILLPFLFLTYLAMEWLEDKTGESSAAMLGRVGRAGHLLGSGIGLIPQCGFSAAAASLYAGGVISVGTMLSVFLSTSDEMLPIFISSAVAPGSIAKILLFKFAIALASGIIVDAVSKVMGAGASTDKHIHDLCEREHCGCEQDGSGIVRSAAVHTLKIAAFIFIVSLLLGLVVESVGKEVAFGLIEGAPIAATFVSGLIGLIPNCAASVIIAELYLDGLFTAGQMMSGLLVGAGVGILVLSRTNRHPKENAAIIAVLYAIGVAWGIIIDALQITF